jgi:hypothetical protein
MQCSYTGHGSGSQYYPSDEVQKLRIQACSILMGCSSGNQYVLGDFEPYGTVLAYIIAGWYLFFLLKFKFFLFSLIII